MSEIINLTIRCDDCGNFNTFQSKGEFISLSDGHKIPLLTPEEEKKVRICESCGAVLE